MKIQLRVNDESVKSQRKVVKRQRKAAEQAGSHHSTARPFFGRTSTPRSRAISSYNNDSDDDSASESESENDNENVQIGQVAMRLITACTGFIIYLVRLCGGRWRRIQRDDM